VVVVVTGAAAPAVAQTVPEETSERQAPLPVIVRAPRRVGFLATAVVGGRLDGGAPGDEVSIQRRTAARWRTVATKAVNDALRVRFRLPDRRFTGRYRLAWAPPPVPTAATEPVLSPSVGDPETVRVRPRLTLHLRPRDVFVGGPVRVSGRLRPHVAGRRVKVARRDGRRWSSVGRARVRHGRFHLRLLPGRAGEMRLRVRFAGDRRNVAARRAGRLTVYDPDPATWYGPGFYGNRTACGRTLGPGTLGVAHRTLPCGTRVSILYGGRTITVPVIDRGPFSSAEWDLTGGTASRLGFSGTGTIGTAHR
jgi:hypothetical protein